MKDPGILKSRIDISACMRSISSDSSGTSFNSPIVPLRLRDTAVIRCLIGIGEDAEGDLLATSHGGA